MIQNMNVMFKTMNMMEEWHITQMNEMRNQISGIKNQKEQQMEMQKMYDKRLKMPQPIKVGSLSSSGRKGKPSSGGKPKQAL